MRSLFHLNDVLYRRNLLYTACDATDEGENHPIPVYNLLFGGLPQAAILTA